MITFTHSVRIRVHARGIKSRNTMLYKKSLDQKLSRIAAGSDDLKDFIIADYDDAWSDFENLPTEFPLCPTLYHRSYDRWFAEARYETADAVIGTMRF